MQSAIGLCVKGGGQLSTPPVIRVHRNDAALPSSGRRIRGAEEERRRARERERTRGWRACPAWPGGLAQVAGVVAQPSTTRIFASVSDCTAWQVSGQRTILVGSAGLS